LIGNKAIAKLPILYNKPEELKKRIMFISVRIKGILEGFIMNTNHKDFTEPMLNFLNLLCQKGKCVPN